MATSKTASGPRNRQKNATEKGQSRNPSETPKGSARRIPAPVHPMTAVSKPSGSSEVQSNDTAPEDALKKNELLQRLSDKTGQPKSQLRPVMDALLEILGEAVAEERPLQIPPLGKIKPLRSKTQGAARVSHVKIRQKSDVTDIS